MKNIRVKLKAELNQDFLTIILEKNKEIIGKIKTANDRTLSKKMLPLLDNFLKKNKISVEEIGYIELKSELPDSFTSFRIVKGILDAIKWNNTRSIILNKA